MTHTTQKWRIENGGISDVRGHAIYRANIMPEGDYRGDICRIQAAPHINGIGNEEAAANARLIAAAPDLADIVRELLAVHIAHHNLPEHARAREILRGLE